MSTVQIESYPIPQWEPTGKTVELWIVSQDAWLASNGTIKLSGFLAPGLVQRVPCSENPTTKVLTVSAFSIDSTTDAQVNPYTKLLGVFYTVRNNKGTKIRVFDILPDGFFVPPTYGGSSTITWEQLVLSNRISAPNRDFSAYSKAESDRQLAAIRALIGSVSNPILSGVTTLSLPITLGALQLDLLTGLLSVGSGAAAIPLTPALNVRMYPFLAKGDGVKTTASIASGHATLTKTSGSFVAADVGKLIDIQGAGASGKNLVTTISAVIAGVATLAVNASTTVSNNIIVYGTNDQAAVQACVTKATTLGMGVYLPLGIYIIGSPGLTVTSDGMSISGDGMWASQMYSVGPVDGSSGTYFSVIDLQAGKFNLRSIGLSGTNWLGVGLALGGSPDGLAALAGTPNSDVLIESCRFDSFFGIGCHAAGNQRRWKIANSQGSLNGSSGFNVNVDDLQMINCTSTDNATGGIECSGTTVSITGGTYSRNRNVGISIGGRTGVGDTGRQNQIIGVTIERNQQGIVVASNNQMTVVCGCTIRQNDTIGIALSNTETSPTASYANRYNLIEGNIISSNGCTLAGASIAGSLTGTAGHGIFCSSPRNLIQNNYIFDEGISNFTQTYGIHIETGTDSVRVLRNHVTGSSNDDYLFDGATNLLFYNDVATSTISAIATTFLYPSPSFNSITLTGSIIEAAPATVTNSGSISFNATGIRCAKLTITANTVFDLFSGTDGQNFTLLLTDAGSHLFTCGGTIRMPATFGTITTAAGKYVIYDFTYLAAASAWLGRTPSQNI